MYMNASEESKKKFKKLEEEETKNSRHRDEALFSDKNLFDFSERMLGAVLLLFIWVENEGTRRSSSYGQYSENLERVR